jgi:hypothetical protein
MQPLLDSLKALKKEFAGEPAVLKGGLGKTSTAAITTKPISFTLRLCGSCYDMLFQRNHHSFAAKGSWLAM